MMLDDDIQFLGVNTIRPRAAHPSVNSVTAFALHIEKNGSEPAYRMMFRKINANTVVVGRKPPGAATFETDSTKAMFRCPVVSRSHAKFTFSDSGSLYLADTSSHHGTFIRQSNELTARVISTESPVQVHNGDVVTFGKSVGRNNEVVRPIVARVELIHQTPTSTSPIKPIPTSGRYGLRLSNTSEDDSSQSESSSEDNVSPSGSSDHESDIVEISPPPRASAVVPSVNRAIRSLILPSEAPQANRDPVALPSLTSHINVDDDDGSMNGHDMFKDIFDFGSPRDTVEDLGSPVLQNKSSFLERLTRRKSARTRFGPSRSRSRSNSPMDLATPSPRSSSSRNLPSSPPPAATTSNAGSPARFSPIGLDLFMFSPPDKNRETAAHQTSLSSMNLVDILHPPANGEASSSSLPSALVQPVDPVPSSSAAAVVSLISSSLQSTSSAAATAGSEEESPFAGHAEEEDGLIEITAIGLSGEQLVPAEGGSGSKSDPQQGPGQGQGREISDRPADAVESVSVAPPGAARDDDTTIDLFADPLDIAIVDMEGNEEEPLELADERAFDEVHCVDDAVGG
ncbi:hypothetical protein GYMLUDRAFT_386411 [Collybiopsis luxurians FD-317 M1]|nr:hypothetical protein GYMLUDRAFT_386411 [Collybiopsis luxurians FD-317 M1]